MKNEPKTKKQLTEELAVLHQKVEELEKSETEHKRMEEALRASSAELARSNQIKTYFAATISHELRNTFNGIMISNELILGDPTSQLSGDQRDLLRSVVGRRHGRSRHYRRCNRFGGLNQRVRRQGRRRHRNGNKHCHE